jgi:hypothetical protein
LIINAYVRQRTEQAGYLELSETLAAIEQFVEIFGCYPSTNQAKSSIVQIAVHEKMQQLAQSTNDNSIITITQFEKARDLARMFSYEAKQTPEEYFGNGDKNQ